jgi:uncharacterized protein YbbC (DUF1343 family)
MLIHSRDLLIKAFPDQLTCLFMIESAHTLDSPTGLPMYSLYSRARRPTKEMFDLFDVLVIDLFDVGTRVYTFLYTMAYCLQAAAAFSKKVLVLDRPNPVGGELVEGNIIQEDCYSFVGLYPIPMRHGLTFGELALLLNNHFNIGADLEVIPMQGWQRHMLFRDTELPCLLRPLIFEPTSNKWAGQACKGFQIHITDPPAFRPYRTSLTLMQAVMLLYPGAFTYKKPPYEYEYERLPMDLILGDRQVRQALEQGKSLLDMENSWQKDLQAFEKLRREVFLYN